MNNEQVLKKRRVREWGRVNEREREGERRIDTMRKEEGGRKRVPHGEVVVEDREKFFMFCMRHDALALPTRLSYGI